MWNRPCNKQNWLSYYLREWKKYNLFYNNTLQIKDWISDFLIEIVMDLSIF